MFAYIRVLLRLAGIRYHAFAIFLSPVDVVLDTLLILLARTIEPLRVGDSFLFDCSIDCLLFTLPKARSACYRLGACVRPSTHTACNREGMRASSASGHLCA